MHRRKVVILQYIAILLVCVLVLSGYSSSQRTVAPPIEETPAAVPVAALPASGYHPIISDEDKADTWALDTATQIQLSDYNSKVTGPGAVAVRGGVKISEAGTYVLSGRMKNGRVVVAVDSDEYTTIVLNGVDIACSTSAPLNFANGKIKLIIAAGTQNTVTDAAQYRYADEAVKEPNACIYADDNLTITGSGTLMVKGNFNNGIGCKDELRIANGRISVEAVNNAIKGNDCVLICGGELELQSQDDGIKSDNDKEEGRGYISISGGVIRIVASDDAFQARSGIYITGGRVSTKAGGRRLNCDGALNIAAGCLGSIADMQ